jgi:hypothetical protein
MPICVLSSNRVWGELFKAKSPRNSEASLGLLAPLAALIVKFLSYSTKGPKLPSSNRSKFLGIFARFSSIFRNEL